MKSILRAVSVDLALLVASAACFALFAWNSLQVDRLSGVGGPLARLAGGHAHRKPSGTPTFGDAGPGSLFFNMDAIWVGKDESATLRFEDGGSLTLSERTLLILKKPFKAARKGGSEAQVEIVKGRASSKTAMIERESARAPELPDFRKSGGSPLRLYPPPDAIIYTRPEATVELTLGWPERQSGFLVIQNQGTGAATYLEINGERSGHVALDQGGVYYWQLIDSGRKVVLGPFRFELRRLTDESARAILKQGKPRQPLEIYW